MTARMGRWRTAALVSVSALAMLLVAAAVISQASGTEGWLALLQKREGQSGWSRLPGGGVPTLWHKETPRTSTGEGWGRLPEHHKPRVRHAVSSKGRHHAALDHQLPAVYHLPAQPSKHTVVTKADRLAAERLARNLHTYHKQAMASPRGRAGQQVAKRLSAARLQLDEKNLPPGFHILRPGQKLPKGAKIVRAPDLASGYHVLRPGMKLPKGASIVSHPPQLAGLQRRARMNIPHVGPRNHMLDEEEGEEGGADDCECEEGDEECECAEPEPRPPPIVNVTEPTPNERIAIAYENHRASRIERIKARELKKSAATMERDGVTLIQSGWEKHKQAQENIEAANAKMEEADAMVANANKVLDLANAHKSEALATKMDDIAEEFQTAAEEKAAKAEEYKAEAETIKAEQEEAEAEEAGGEEEGR